MSDFKNENSMLVHGGSSIAFSASLEMLQQDTFLSFVILGSCKFGISTIVLGSFGFVHSSACSAQLLQNHRIQFWDHFLKSWGALKQFLECMHCNFLPGATRTVD